MGANDPDRRFVVRSLIALASSVPLVAAEDDAPVRLDVGGGHLEVSFAGQGFDLPRPAILDWVKQSARAVAGYYGTFPVPRARLRIEMAQGERGVSRGKCFGYNGPRCRIAVGQHTTARELERDWMLTHEMVHFAFPSVPERHHWIEEGTATYVEPIARAAIGNVTPERVWFEMVRDMPQGQPEVGDEGLDHTPTWGRTYWGGAIFCLMADVGIRKNTRNRFGLRDALRAINRAGGTIESNWPLERALETGDKATHGKVLIELYREMSAKPVTVDLAGLWRQLGIRRSGGAVTFDNDAPLRSIREAILAA